MVDARRVSRAASGVRRAQEGCSCSPSAVARGVGPFSARVLGGVLRGGRQIGVPRRHRRSSEGVLRRAENDVSCVEDRVVVEAPTEDDIAAFRDDVSVAIEQSDARNVRTLTAETVVGAPVDAVWRTLTRYDALDEFIPGLAVNECVETFEGGSILRQVGETKTGVGLTFKANVLLRIEEHPKGLASTHRLFEYFGCPDEAMRDITLEQIEGDFKEFDGIWSMAPGAEGNATTRLVYKLRVKPQPWLPIALVIRRVSWEVQTNLSCVRIEAERKSKC